jgi:hypothetical protein
MQAAQDLTLYTGFTAAANLSMGVNYTTLAGYQTVRSIAAVV